MFQSEAVTLTLGQMRNTRLTTTNAVVLECVCLTDKTWLLAWQTNLVSERLTTAPTRELSDNETYAESLSSVHKSSLRCNKDLEFALRHSLARNAEST